jgi:hypothetical protein
VSVTPIVINAKVEVDDTTARVFLARVEHEYGSLDAWLKDRVERTATEERGADALPEDLRSAYLDLVEKKRDVLRRLAL